VVVQQGLGRVLFTDDLHHRIGKLVPVSEMKAPHVHSLAFMAAMTAWTPLIPYGGATQLHRRAINLGLLNFSISPPGGLFVSLPELRLRTTACRCRYPPAIAALSR